MPLTVTVDGHEVDVSDIDLSLDAFSFEDCVRLGYALGNDDAIALLEADPVARRMMLGSERVRRAVLWAKLAPRLLAAMPQGDATLAPEDVTVTTATPPPDLQLAQVPNG